MFLRVLRYNLTLFQHVCLQWQRHLQWLYSYVAISVSQQFVDVRTSLAVIVSWPFLSWRINFVSELDCCFTVKP